MRLEFTHEVTSFRKSGNIHQVMVLGVDYDPEEDGIDDITVNLYQQGKHMGEISDLLDKAEGKPLCTMVEAVDWRELYQETCKYKEAV